MQFFIRGLQRDIAERVSISHPNSFSQATVLGCLFGSTAPQSSVTNTRDSRTVQRLQVFHFNNLVPARCKSHQDSRGIRTRNQTHTHTHTEHGAADTDSEIQCITQSGERARTTAASSTIWPFIRDTQSDHPTSQIHNFTALLNHSHPSDAEVLAPRLIGTCIRLASLGIPHNYLPSK